MRKPEADIKGGCGGAAAPPRKWGSLGGAGAPPQNAICKNNIGNYKLS